MALSQKEQNNLLNLEKEIVDYIAAKSQPNNNTNTNFIKKYITLLESLIVNNKERYTYFLRKNRDGETFLTLLLRAMPIPELNRVFIKIAKFSLENIEFNTIWNNDIDIHDNNPSTINKNKANKNGGIALTEAVASYKNDIFWDIMVENANLYWNYQIFTQEPILMKLTPILNAERLIKLTNNKNIEWNRKNKAADRFATFFHINMCYKIENSHLFFEELLKKNIIIHWNIKNKKGKDIYDVLSLNANIRFFRIFWKNFFIKITDNAQKTNNNNKRLNTVLKNIINKMDEEFNREFIANQEFRSKIERENEKKYIKKFFSDPQIISIISNPEIFSWDFKQINILKKNDFFDNDSIYEKIALVNNDPTNTYEINGIFRDINLNNFTKEFYKNLFSSRNISIEMLLQNIHSIANTSLQDYIVENENLFSNKNYHNMEERKKIINKIIIYIQYTNNPLFWEKLNKKGIYWNSHNLYNFIIINQNEIFSNTDIDTNIDINKKKFIKFIDEITQNKTINWENFFNNFKNNINDLNVNIKNIINKKIELKYINKYFSHQIISNLLQKSIVPIYSYGTEEIIKENMTTIGNLIIHLQNINNFTISSQKEIKKILEKISSFKTIDTLAEQPLQNCNDIIIIENNLTLPNNDILAFISNYTLKQQQQQQQHGGTQQIDFRKENNDIQQQFNQKFRGWENDIEKLKYEEKCDYIIPMIQTIKNNMNYDDLRFQNVKCMESISIDMGGPSREVVTDIIDDIFSMNLFKNESLYQDENKFTILNIKDNANNLFNYKPFLIHLDNIKNNINQIKQTPTNIKKPLDQILVEQIRPHITQIKNVNEKITSFEILLKNLRSKLNINDILNSYKEIYKYYLDNKEVLDSTNVSSINNIESIFTEIEKNLDMYTKIGKEEEKLKIFTQNIIKYKNEDLNLGRNLYEYIGKLVGTIFKFMSIQSIKTNKINFPVIINYLILKNSHDIAIQEIFNSLRKIDIINLLKYDTKNHKYIIDKFYMILADLGIVNTEDIDDNNYNAKYSQNYILTLNENYLLFIQNLLLIFKNFSMTEYINIFSNKDYTNNMVINLIKHTDFDPSRVDEDFLNIFKEYINLLNKEQLQEFVKNVSGTNTSLPQSITVDKLRGLYPLSYTSCFSIVHLNPLYYELYNDHLLYNNIDYRDIYNYLKKQYFDTIPITNNNRKEILQKAIKDEFIKIMVYNTGYGLAGGSYKTKSEKYQHKLNKINKLNP